MKRLQRAALRLRTEDLASVDRLVDELLPQHPEESYSRASAVRARVSLGLREVVNDPERRRNVARRAARTAPPPHWNPLMGGHDEFSGLRFMLCMIAFGLLTLVAAGLSR